MENKVILLEDENILFEANDFVFYLEGDGEIQTVKLFEKKMLSGISDKASIQPLTSMDKAKKLFNKHPFLIGVGAGLILNKLKNRKFKNKKILEFAAYTPQEKKMYTDTVNALLKTGKYRKLKFTFRNKAWIWKLEKIG